jgi:dihydrofolate synthase/folylpolyglutamate synthase
MDYPRALKAIEARQETKIIPGLSRIRAHLKLLGDPQENLRVLHVAGTNGKGSVCAILESVLMAAGYKTGFYLSPHLQSPRERIRLAGRDISKKDFARILNRTLRLDSKKELTYFEIITSMAFQYFMEKKADIVVLETGLGGRLDATNVIKRPLAALISSIDFDHMNWLGPRLQDIAFEKAGIIKRGRPVFCSNLPASALKVVRARALELAAPIVVVKKPWKFCGVDWKKNRQSLRSPWGEVIELSLHGDKQGQNVALAEAALSYLNLSDDLNISRTNIKTGLSSVSWPGRFEIMRFHGRVVIFDGAHNPEAMRNLARTWRSSPWAKEPSLWIVGMMKDKDVSATLKVIAPQIRSLVAIAPPNPRALSADSLATLARLFLPRASIFAARNIEEALGIWHNGVERALVVCGSFYLIASVKAALLEDRKVAHGKK